MALEVAGPLVLLASYELWAFFRHRISTQYQRYVQQQITRSAEVVNASASLQNRYALKVMALSLLAVGFLVVVLGITRGNGTTDHTRGRRRHLGGSRMALAHQKKNGYKDKYSMIKASFESQRHLRTETLSADLVIVGEGSPVPAAPSRRPGRAFGWCWCRTVPVLGGNSSSEVRLWILGATSHMGNNNRWAREGGVIDKVLVDNTYRNPEGNPLILDTILLEKVVEEDNITLLLNTAVYEVEKEGNDTIRRVTAFCSQNSTRYQLSAPLFCDASGDGIAGFLARGSL